MSAAVKKRFDIIDIIKGLGIICVCLGHSGFPYSHFISLFHMPIFFICSGFCFKSLPDKSGKGYLKYCWGKIKTLWFPFVFWNTFFVLTFNLCLNLNIYTNNADVFNYISSSYVSLTTPYTGMDFLINTLKGFAFLNETQMTGAFWFIRSLFLVSLTFCGIDLLLVKVFKIKHVLLVQLFISIVFVVGGYLIGKFIPNSDALNFLTAYIFFYFGYIFKIYKDKILSKLNSGLYMLILMFSLGLLILLDPYGYVTFNSNHYSNLFYLLGCGFLGWCFLFSLAYFIDKWIISKVVFKYLGQYSLPILIFHFLSFKIVTVFVCLANNLPLMCVAAFPHLYGDQNGLWALYSLVGLLIPLLAHRLYHLAYDPIKRKISDSIKRKKEIKAS